MLVCLHADHTDQPYTSSVCAVLPSIPVSTASHRQHPTKARETLPAGLDRPWPDSEHSPSFHTLQVQPPTSLLPPRAPAQRLRCQRSLAPPVLPGESRPSRDAFRLGLTVRPSQ